MMTTLSLTELLEKTLVKDLIKSSPLKELIVIQGNTSAKDACAILSQNRINSAPVQDEKTGDLLGVFDYSDLVKFTLESFHKIPKENALEVDVSMDLTEVVKGSIPSEPVFSVIKHSRTAANWGFILSTSTLKEAIKLLVDNKWHRLLVVEENAEKMRKFTGVVSETLIISYIANHFVVTSPDDWNIGEHPVKDLNIIDKEVPGVSPDQSVLDALKVMHTKNVHALAIVGKKLSSGLPELLGSLSMSDIKEIFAVRTGWRKLFDQSFQFFQFLRMEQGITKGKDSVPSFTINPDSTLLNVIKKMAAVKSHQVWVVESSAHDLVGVISVADVMPLLV